MSCLPCDETKDVAYVRVDKANVGLIGCDEHVRKVLDMLEACREMVKEYGLELVDSGRTIYRVKSGL